MITLVSYSSVRWRVGEPTSTLFLSLGTRPSSIGLLETKQQIQKKQKTVKIQVFTCEKCCLPTWQHTGHQQKPFHAWSCAVDQQTSHLRTESGSKTPYYLLCDYRTPYFGNQQDGVQEFSPSNMRCSQHLKPIPEKSQCSRSAQNEMQSMKTPSPYALFQTWQWHLYWWTMIHTDVQLINAISNPNNELLVLLLLTQNNPNRPPS